MSGLTSKAFEVLSLGGATRLELMLGKLYRNIKNSLQPKSSVNNIQVEAE
jgi:hypothetical protein